MISVGLLSLSPEALRRMAGHRADDETSGTRGECRLALLVALAAALTALLAVALVAG